MTNFGAHNFVLSAVGAAFVFSLLVSESSAEELTRITDGTRAKWTVKIESGKLEPGEPTGIVISPSRQAVGQSASGEPEVPILVAPGSDEEPAEKSRVKKAGKKSAKDSPKKAGQSSVATETASKKAREEWQKKEPVSGGNRRPNGKNSTEKKGEKAKNERTSQKEKASDGSRSKETAAKAVLEARKRAMAAQAKAKSGRTSAETKSVAKAPNVAGAAKAQAMAARRAGGLRDSRSYREIYNSIPFSRAEYDANPAYRHLATMEIMLGQLHPVIVAPPAPPRQETRREITVRFLPAIRPGYRPYSQYPWH